MESVLISCCKGTSFIQDEQHIWTIIPNFTPLFGVVVQYLRCEYLSDDRMTGMEYEQTKQEYDLIVYGRRG